MLTVLATAVAWGTALVLLLRGRGASARRLALLLFIDGAAVITTETGLLQWVRSEQTARTIALAHCVMDVAIMTLYLPFVAAALNTRWLSVFRTSTGRRAITLVGLAVIAAIWVTPGAFVSGSIHVDPPQYVNWAFQWGPAWTYVGVGLVIVFSLALMASIQAWKAAETDLLRQRAKVFMWAFGTRDGVWAAIYLLAVFAGDQLSLWHLAVLLQLYAASLLVYSLLIGYGILAAQLLDIDLQIRWTIKQGTVAAAFIALFFLVSEVATTFLSDTLGQFLGLAASALLVFALTPLQRFGDRVAGNAMPGVSRTEEYSSYRKLQIYAAACEAAYQDGDVTDRERRMLSSLRESLAIRPDDAAQLEADLASGRHLLPSLT